MAGFFDRYNTDRNLEEEGVWVDFGDGVKVRLRRINSKISRDCRRKLEKPYTTQFRGREMPDNLQEDLLNKQLAKAIIVEWEGVPNPENPDQMLECTEDNVLKLMANEELKDFREDILTASMAQATFAKADTKAKEGNLENSSSGS